MKIIYFLTFLWVNTLLAQNFYPTIYYVVDENTFSCIGQYLNVSYLGTERTSLYTPEGEFLEEVCTRFSKALAMEGTGILKNGKTVNWAGNYKYSVVKTCKYGIGAQKLCLIPFYTIAADLKVYSLNDAIYIKEAQGLKLPDGTTHNGLFLVRDTGSAFVGVGDSRIDIFSGTQPDYNNVFKDAGFTLSVPLSGYILKDTEKEKALEFFNKTFPELMKSEESILTF